MVHLRRCSCPSQGRFRGLLDKCSRGRAACSPRSADANPASSAKPPRGLATLQGFCLGSPDWPPMQGLLARLVSRYARDAAQSAGFAKTREGRHPHRIAGDEPMLPGILWGCRACGAQRRVPGNSPAALERACGRWGLKGRRRGALPLAASAGSGSPRRLRLPLRWGHGRPFDNAQRRALPGRLVGWRVGDARDLTRSRGFAAADHGGRLHLPASVVEVHVAARRLRRIVPLGIRPNGTIPLREEGSSLGSTRPFELSSGVLLCAKR